MSRFRCPRCPQTLDHVRREALRWWQCPEGHGRLFNFTVLKKRTSPEQFRAFWTCVRTQDQPGTVGCPSCGRSMRTVHQTAGTVALELDVCKGCQLTWFDHGEDRVVAGALPETKPQAHAHLPQDDQLAIQLAEAQLTMAASRHQQGYGEAPSGVSTAARLAAFFGVPVEDNAPVRSLFPIMSWGLCAGILLGSGIALTQIDHVYDAYGFIPASPLRKAGGSALVGLILDPQIVHALFAATVFGKLGDNVEDVIGHFGLVGLVSAATVGCWIAQAIVFAGSDLPSFGLLAASTAIAAFYALRFPEVRLGWLGRSHYTWGHRSGRTRWARHRLAWHAFGPLQWFLVPIRTAVLSLVVLVSVLPLLERGLVSPTAWLDAPVGAAIGAAAWALFGKGVLRHPDENPATRVHG